MSAEDPTRKDLDSNKDQDCADPSRKAGSMDPPNRPKPVVLTYTRDTNMELHKYFQVVRLADVNDDPELRSRVEGLVYIPTEVSPATQLMPLVSRLPGLRVMMTTGMGVDFMEHIFPHCKSHGIVVAGNPGNQGAEVVLADYTMSLLLSAARMVTYGHLSSRRGVTKENIDAARFRALSQSRMVSGAILGIVGLGNLGFGVASRAHRGFNMKILYNSRTRKDSAIEESLCATYCPNLHAMLPFCDFLLLSCALTEETRGLIAHKELELMKETALLVNVARGKVVDTDALVSALESGAIGGAALDVTEPEPLPASHPLLAMDNVIVTPHMAFTHMQYFEDMHRSITANLISVLLENKLPEQPVVVPYNWRG